MTRSFRFLGAGNSSAVTTAKTAESTSEQQPATLDSDFVVILAALLCTIICVLGLIAVARCVWLPQRCHFNYCNYHHHHLDKMSSSTLKRMMAKKILEIRSHIERKVNKEFCDWLAEICVLSYNLGQLARNWLRCELEILSNRRSNWKFTFWVA